MLRAQPEDWPPTERSYSYHIQQADSAIRLDGRLRERAWQTAEVADSFYQMFPFDTSYALTRTEVMLTYDDQNLYVAAINHDDSLPGQYVTQSLGRDFSYPRNDAFAVFLDPTGDQTNGFSFAVTPQGAYREGLLQSGGRFGVTTSWDTPWQAEVTQHPDHWVVEMAIPFKSLRFKEAVGQWGINFGRHNLKINEQTAWYPVPRNFNVATMSFNGDLVWDQPPPTPDLNLALIPYTTGSINQDLEQASHTDEGEPIDRTTLDGDAGLNAKLAVTSSLNLDMTLNPDFSQVEVDRQITNLSRFELFFPERRLFFLENSDLFANFGFSRIRPFFSRRIGLFRGESVPIIGGARLSGKVNKDWRIGAMSVQTNNVASLDLAAQNYTVLAAQRRVFRRSSLGLIFVNRQSTPRPDSSFSNFNRILGADFDLFSNNSHWFGKFFYHQSFQPDQPANAFATAGWLRYTDATWQFDWNHEYIGSNYKADVGFVPRRDVIRFEPFITRFFYPDGDALRRIRLRLYHNEYRELDGDLLDNTVQLSTALTFGNTGTLNLSLNHNRVRLQDPFDPTNTEGKELPVSIYRWQDVNLSYNNGPRSQLSWSLGSRYGSFYNGERLQVNGSMFYRFQPYARVGANFNHNEIWLPDSFANASLTLVSPELRVTFTRNMFLSVFTQVNTQIENVNLNARFQWRYLPMSDIFLVLTENYNSTNLAVRNRQLVLKVNYWLQS